MIAVVAKSPAWGRAFEVKRAFALTDRTELICESGQQRESFRGLDACADHYVTNANREELMERLTHAKLMFVVGATGLETLWRLGGIGWTQPKLEAWAQRLNLAVWWVDTAYLQARNEYDALVERIGCRVFAMPDLIGDGEVPLLHPFTLPPLRKKSEALTAIHSPGYEKRRTRKGSEIIESAIPDGIEYRCLMGLTVDEVVEAKASAHIVIDQVPPDGTHTGLGQSGIEGLAGRCIVLSRMYDHERTQGYFEGPPVVDVRDTASLKAALEEIVRMPREERLRRQDDGRAWVRAHLSLTRWREYVEKWL